MRRLLQIKGPLKQRRRCAEWNSACVAAIDRPGNGGLRISSLPASWTDKERTVGRAARTVALAAVSGRGQLPAFRGFFCLTRIKPSYLPDLLNQKITSKLNFHFHFRAHFARMEIEMGKFIQASAVIAIAATASAAWGQAAPPQPPTAAADLYDSAGKAVGQYKGDSVIISYNNQPLRIYTDAHWDYAQGRPVSSGLTWKHVPVYYAPADCTGQAYIATAPTAPTAQGSPAPSAGPPYTPPAYGSQYLAAPSRQGTQWTAYVSAQNPTYTQYPIQSERQYDGSCAAKSYPGLWATPVQTTVPLDTYGVPPLYAR